MFEPFIHLLELYINCLELYINLLELNINCLELYMSNLDPETPESCKRPPNRAAPKPSPIEPPTFCPWKLRVAQSRGGGGGGGGVGSFGQAVAVEDIALDAVDAM